MRVSAGVLHQQVISTVMPAYTEALRRTGAGGRATIGIVVDKSGKLANARVIDGEPRLGQISLEAIKQWRWKPYILNGEPVAALSTVILEYKADTGEILINPWTPPPIGVRKSYNTGEHQ